MTPETKKRIEEAAINFGNWNVYGAELGFKAGANFGYALVVDSIQGEKIFELQKQILSFQDRYNAAMDENARLREKLAIALEPINEIADHGSFRGWDVLGSGFSSDSLRKNLKELRNKIRTDEMSAEKGKV